MKKNLWIASALMLLMAAGAAASNFRAADLVYVPNAGKLTGGGGAFFYQTDVWISNPNSTPATVWVGFALQGQDNSNLTTVKLPTDLAANERREINDIIGTLFPSQAGTPGHLIFFGERTGLTSAPNCDPTTGNPADCRAISVMARVYAQTGTKTYGMTVAGIPWYNYVSPSAIDAQLREVFITGIREQGSINVSGFRTNIGLVNASGTQNADLRVTLYRSDGSAVNTVSETLPPLGMVQRSIASMFPGFTGTGWVRVEQVDTAQLDLAFLAYGTLNDNQTGDITWLESQFPMGWDDTMARCIYGAKPPRRLVTR